MRVIAILVAVIALAVSTVVYLGGKSEESAEAASFGDSQAGLQGRRKILRGAGWIGEEPDGLFSAGDSERLLVFVEPDSARSHPFLRGVRGIIADMPQVEVVWLTTADELQLEAWMDELGLVGPALFGMERDVVTHFGGSTLPMLRLIDKRGRIIARDLIGLKAHSLTGTRPASR